MNKKQYFTSIEDIKSEILGILGMVDEGLAKIKLYVSIVKKDPAREDEFIKKSSILEQDLDRYQEEVRLLFKKYRSLKEKYGSIYQF